LDSLVQDLVQGLQKAVAKTPGGHPTPEPVDMVALFGNISLAWLLQLVCSQKN